MEVAAAKLDDVRGAQETNYQTSVAAGSWGGRRLSLADYVMGPGAARGRPLPKVVRVAYPHPLRKDGGDKAPRNGGEPYSLRTARAGRGASV